MRRHLAILAAALTFCLPAVVLTAGNGAGALPNAVDYALPSVTAAPNAPCDIQPCQVLSYSFTGSGSTSTAGAPASGTFMLGFTASRYKNGSSCAFAAGTGTGSIIWQDSSTTDVTFTFKEHDSHSWDIKGQVTSGSNTAFPPSPATAFGGLVGYPPNPCDGANVTATVTFFPSSPI
jgi:hypothetical protein